MHNDGYSQIQSAQLSHLMHDKKTTTSAKNMLSKGRRVYLKREWNKKLFTFDNMSKMDQKI